MAYWPLTEVAWKLRIQCATRTTGSRSMPMLLDGGLLASLSVRMARATAAGASVLTGPYVLPSGSRVAFLRDPDGYDLELVQKAG